MAPRNGNKSRKEGVIFSQSLLVRLLIYALPLIGFMTACIHMSSVIEEKDALISKLAHELQSRADSTTPSLRAPQGTSMRFKPSSPQQPLPLSTSQSAVSLDLSPAATSATDSVNLCIKNWQIQAFERLKEYGGKSVETLFDLLANTAQFQPALVFDVGANTGLSTEMFLKWSKNRDSSKPMTIHSFEPNELAFTPLSRFVEKLRHQYSGKARIHIHGVAVSDKSGSATLYSATKKPGKEKERTAWATLGKKGKILGTVETITLSDFVRQNIGSEEMPINFLKIDTEGHDGSVLQGAEDLLAASKIELIVFEFGGNWGLNGKYLRDAVDLLTRYGYASFLLGETFHIRLDENLFDDVYETVKLGNIFAMKKDYPLWDRLMMKNSHERSALGRACPQN
jgi:FkbM family methyltransferase